MPNAKRLFKIAAQHILKSLLAKPMGTDQVADDDAKTLGFKNWQERLAATAA